jgi:hypothetical protein
VPRGLSLSSLNRLLKKEKKLMLHLVPEKRARSYKRGRFLRGVVGLTLTPVATYVSDSNRIGADIVVMFRIVSTKCAIAASRLIGTGLSKAEKIKALSWVNLRIEMSACVQRHYVKVVF